jgi:hypothetical protein
MNGEMFKLVGSRMPKPPSYAKPPFLWGDEDHVRSLLEPHGLEVTCEPQVALFQGTSVEDVVTRMETYFGPWKMAQAALGDEWPALRAELVDLYNRNSEEPEPGRVEAAAAYLMTVATKPGS